MKVRIEHAVATGTEDRLPLQIEGLLSNGESFYFRARQASISLGIGAGLDDAARASCQAVDQARRDPPTNWRLSPLGRGSAVELERHRDADYPVDDLSWEELMSHLDDMLSPLFEAGVYEHHPEVIIIAY